MRNIKLFENFESDDNSAYYEEISEDDVQTIKRKIGSFFAVYDEEGEDEDIENTLDTEEITSDEVEKIMKFFPDCPHESESDGELLIFQSSENLHGKEILVDITKTNDEWYYITLLFNVAASYKCDQFDGLIKLLKDKSQEIANFLVSNKSTIKPNKRYNNPENIDKITNKIVNNILRYENYKTI
jgi:hypothetical protein